MSTDWVSVFNKKLDEFTTELSTTFTEVRDFQFLRNTVRLGISMTPAIPYTIFMEHVTKPYEKYILERNEEFFLQEDYNNALKETNSQTSFDIVKQIKTIWVGLDEGNKDVIWKYLSVLVVLSKRCPPV